MDIVGHNLRHRRPDVRPAPATRMHMGLAWPIFRAYSWLGFAAPAVVLQSLLVTVTGLTRMSAGAYPAFVVGAFVVYLGHILAHAGRLLAAEKGITAWGRFLDGAVARIIEVTMLVMIAWSEARGLKGVPSWLPPAWEPLALPSFLAVCGAALAMVLLWRYLEALHDVLVLRTHLLATRHVPGPTSFSHRSRRVAFSRDLLFLTWLAAILLHQVQAFVFLVLAAHAVAALAAIGRFHKHMSNPGDEASWILSREYQG